MLIHKSIHVAWIVALAASVAGCNPAPLPPPELVEVNGTILLDGLPVPEAKVLFVPDGSTLSSQYALSYGTTDSLGKFDLKQADGTVGALPGRHRVYLSTLNRPNQSNEREKSILHDNLPLDGEEFPEFYNRHSELQYEVLAGQGILRPEFDLSSIDPLLKDEAN